MSRQFRPDPFACAAGLLGSLPAIATWGLSRASLLGVLWLVGGCSPPAAVSGPKAGPPAKVERLPQETEIGRITLTEDAERRLGITLGRVTRENVQRQRTFGGDVMIPAGQTIVVSAPVTGTLAAPDSKAIPVPGQHVEAGEPVMALLPLLSPERDVPTPVERIQMANARAALLAAHMVAKGDVERGRAEVEAAEISLQRADKLLADKAGSAMAADDARGLLNVAQSTLHAAEEREQQLAQLARSLDPAEGDGQATPLVVISPASGLVRHMGVSRGQTVSTGATLFEVVNTDTMWVRVPIYVDLLPEVAADADAQIVGLDGRRDFEPRVAHPVHAPPSADALSTTADLYFETDNADGRLRPGQRVGVELSLRRGAGGSGRCCQGHLV